MVVDDTVVGFDDVVGVMDFVVVVVVDVADGVVDEFEWILWCRDSGEDDCCVVVLAKGTEKDDLIDTKRASTCPSKSGIVS